MVQLVLADNFRHPPGLNTSSFPRQSPGIECTELGTLTPNNNIALNEA